MIRLQLALADNTLISAQTFNTLFTMPATMSSWWHANPCRFANYLVRSDRGA